MILHTTVVCVRAKRVVSLVCYVCARCRLSADKNKNKSLKNKNKSLKNNVTMSMDGCSTISACHAGMPPWMSGRVFHSLIVAG